MSRSLNSVLVRCAACAVLLVLSVEARAATIVVNNLDGAGEGFNDPTAVAPIGGNSGTTLGAQRLIAFQAAANIWGAQLDSTEVMQVNATMDPLSCTTFSGVLGAAGPNSVSKDFSGAPLSNHWYSAPLANSLAHTNLFGGADITARFNSNLGNADCLAGSGWYLGLDGSAGNLTDLITVVLHELGHGVGFITFVDPTNGAQLGGVPDVFDHFMLDLDTGAHWDAMNDAQRMASAQNTRFVVWDGPTVTSRVPQLLQAGSPLLTVSAPPTLQGEVVMTPASFGPTLPSTPISGTLQLVTDSGGVSSSDGCEAIAGSLSGKIALIDRGNCLFTTKVHNAQNAGANAVLIADNVAGSPPATMTGDDPAIAIPSARITLADGNAFKVALSSGSVSLSVSVDLARYGGADAAHRVMLYTPQPIATGSSLSHWDPLAFPNLLMEPSLNGDQGHGTDLTLSLLQDTGWHVNTVAAAAVPVVRHRWLVLSLVGFVAAGLWFRRAPAGQPAERNAAHHHE